MTDEEQEAQQIAQVDVAADKAKQTIRDYFAMRRGGLLGGSTFHANSAQQQQPASHTPAARAKTKELIKLVLDAIEAHPLNEFTFPEIAAYLAGKGRELSRNQMRTVTEAIVGKSPVFLKTPRSGSVAAVYSKSPVNGTDYSEAINTLDLSAYQPKQKEGT